MNHLELFPDTMPDASRPRSYNGSYMEAGKKAEQAVLGWLQQRPEILGLTDLRPFRPMREADVDFGLALTDGRYTLAEVKSDRHLGKGNFIFEVLRINHTAPPDRAVTLGWSARSPAKWLLLYSPNESAIYQVTMDDYRTALQKLTDVKRKDSHLVYVPTDSIKSTINFLIPASFVEATESYRRHVLA